MPCIILFATAVSLVFGCSSDQFLLGQELTIMKGQSILGFIVPLFIAPLAEELGWRGYGVDSLRSRYNLFLTSLIFGILWSLWHLPLLFVEGSYQNQLRDLGFAYVVNFFVSILILAFLLNWLYYKVNRSIFAMVLCHGMINFSSMLFRTEPFTKCIVTILLGLAVIGIIVLDGKYFFRKKFSL